MKKPIKQLLATLLILSFALSLMCSCNTQKPNTNDNNNPPANSDLEEITNKDETSTTDSVIEQLELTLLTGYDLTNASIWGDSEGEYYIYLNEWSAFRHLPGLSSYHSLSFNDNCMAVSDEAATISVVDQPGKHNNPRIITYNLNKGSEPTEVNNVLLDIRGVNPEEYIFFVNMHSAEHGYYFLTPGMYGWMDEGMERPHDWPIYMFETTDGGKSWNQLATNTFHFVSKYIEFFKFVSPKVGIISSRDVWSEEVFDRTYLTVDGGLTWNRMPELPHGDLSEWYSEVIDLEYDKDYKCYYLTVETVNHHHFLLRFRSEDLITWNFYPHYKK